MHHKPAGMPGSHRRIPARTQAAGVAGLLLLRPALVENLLRLTGMLTQALQHQVSRGQGRLQGSFLTAILFIGEIAGEMHLVAADGDTPALE